MELEIAVVTTTAELTYITDTITLRKKPNKGTSAL